ncbi:TetR/AcrR family transcriptional regulator [Glycomyces salinus]|uniref:TetR/AcrR family transcriptional regulator n=1 Tax=Glycomyces salinus TaxID=980294 RepID=UPI0018ECD303|nr:TetR/AcrR family transcriptional regulator [Glycomyces salinus]
MSAKAAGRDRPTLTERARRAQFIQVTIDLVARHGYAGTSLAKIAEAAGVSKAAVLYHFPTKNAVVQAAYAEVIEALTDHVGTELSARSGAAALETYVRSLVSYMTAHHGHARMIIAAITEDSGVGDGTTSASRWQNVGLLIDAAKGAGDYRPEIDSRATAVIANGAVDAIVAQWLEDPGFDAAAAAEALVEMLDRSLRV